MTYRRNSETKEVIKFGMLGCLFLIGLVVLGIALGSLLLMVAWNFVVPSVFGGPTLQYHEAFGLMLLLSIVGGAFRSTLSIRRE
jgi:hypothetical protein